MLDPCHHTSRTWYQYFMRMHGWISQFCYLMWRGLINCSMNTDGALLHVISIQAHSARQGCSRVKPLWSAHGLHNSYITTTCDYTPLPHCCCAKLILMLLLPSVCCQSSVSDIKLLEILINKLKRKSDFIPTDDMMSRELLRYIKLPSVKGEMFALCVSCCTPVGHNCSSQCYF